MRTMRDLRLCVMTAMCVCGGIETVAVGAGLTTQHDREEIIRVALFAEGDCTDGKSRDAIYRTLSGHDDIRIDKVSSATVRTPDFMKHYDVLILPGGTGSGQANAVGVEAGKRIAASVKEGKGIVAICAGGYYLAKGGNEAGQALDIINVRNHDGDHWARGEGYIAVEVLNAKDGQSSRTMWYENGPLFKPAEGAALPVYAPLVRYVTDMAAEGAPNGQMKGRDAVVAASYGKGRVVLFGPHPELSPGLHHWLINSVRWAAGNRDGGTSEVTVQSVLGE